MIAAFSGFTLFYLSSLFPSSIPAMKRQGLQEKRASGGDLVGGNRWRLRKAFDNFSSFSLSPSPAKG